MLRFHRWLVVWAGIGVGMIPQPATSYGPNVIDTDGIVIWDLPIIYDVESDVTIDSCSKDLSSLAATAFATWVAAPETNLTTTERSLGAAVDGDNVCDYLYDASACPSGPTSGPPTGGVSPIVYDENGEIIAQFFGVTNRFRTLGFAGIISFNSGTNRAVKGEGVINVACVNGCAAGGCSQSFSDDDVLAFIQHESGHFLGLNHTQVNEGVDDNAFRPTMFALFSAGSGSDIKTLNRDDEVGVAYLYPAGSLDANNCTVTGTIRDGNGDEFQCANVVARNTESSESLTDAISFVSGGDKEGGTTAAGRGVFSIKGLAPANTYQIEVEPISTEGQLSQPASGIIPCNGGNGNPSPPTFDEQTVSDTVTCVAASSGLVATPSGAGQGLNVTQGETITLSDVTVTNTSGNVADEGADDDDDDDGSSSGGGGGGCALFPPARFSY